MASIKKINENIDKLNSILTESFSALDKDKSNFALRLSISNIKTQIEQLQHQLYEENLAREKEIVQLRFMGKVAKLGTFPLHLIGGLTDPFSQAILTTSKYRQFGTKGGKRIDKIVTDTINLKLEGIGRGSTIFYLSATTSPDLFGNSVIQSSLDNVFTLLKSESSEQLIDNISYVGSNSIKYYSDFLKELNKDDLEIELKWHTPSEKVQEWYGTKDKILTLYNTLTKIKLSEPEEVDFTGEIITLSAKGKFEILSSDKERFIGSFSNELMQSIKQLHIGQYCKGIMLKTTIFNSATNKEKFEYSLKQITAID
jgi:hypothetical protein